MHRKAFLEQNFYFNEAGSHPAQAKMASQCPHRSPTRARLSKQNSSQKNILFPMKRIPVSNVALCRRRKKYAPCDFPTSFRLHSFIFYFPGRHALAAVSAPNIFWGQSPPPAYSNLNSVATRY
jgi:hypothetical protein